ncbi:MAG: phage tail protein, partial [bacterium]
MANFVFDYNIEKTIAAFEIDNSLKNLLLINNLYIADDGLNKNPERISLYKNVANLLLTNGETIYNTSIDKLYSNSFLINELNVIFEKYTNEVSPVNEDVYKGILYSFKHAITKTFFQDNFTNFLPSLDADTIENSEKRNLFIKSIMHEYDKFSDKISEISNITNIDKADNETLEYLSGLLGFSREENDKISISLFRGIAKNILEVYKIKGTAYSVEVFFNLLGFTIDVIEFWFDKRYYSDEIYSNPITGVVSRTSFLRYVSDKKPSLYIPEDDNGNKNFPIIQDSQITSIRDRNYFDKTINEASNKIEALEKMLGENGGIPDQDLDYTYFKTNLVYYNVQRFQKTNSESSLTFDDKIIVENYIKFLTPIFMNSLLVFEVIITDGNEENSGIDASNIFINDTNNITLNNNKIGHSFYTEFNKQERESHVFNYLFSEEFLNNFQEETNDLLGESDNLNNNENNFKNSMDTIVDQETLNGDETFANDSDALGALPWLYY